MWAENLKKQQKGAKVCLSYKMFSSMVSKHTCIKKIGVNFLFQQGCIKLIDFQFI